MSNIKFRRKNVFSIYCELSMLFSLDSNISKKLNIHSTLKNWKGKFW